MIKYNGIYAGEIMKYVDYAGSAKVEGVSRVGYKFNKDGTFCHRYISARKGDLVFTTSDFNDLNKNNYELIDSKICLTFSYGIEFQQKKFIEILDNDTLLVYENKLNFIKLD